MKKALCAIFCFLAGLMLVAANADGFSSDPESINAAAKSVLMLEIFDEKNNVVATGSGFVMFDNMTLVTNYHVIEDASMIVADSDDGYQYYITKVLVADKAKDIAILQFMTPTVMVPLTPATQPPMRGETVVAIGSPIGLKNTVSMGNISLIYKDENKEWIQFTAAISHGSSGGALFNNYGEVIGVTSAFWEDGQNLNLAININETIELYRNWTGNKVNIKDFWGPTATVIPPSPTPKPESKHPPEIVLGRYPYNFTVEVFKKTFSELAASMGANFNWEESPRDTDGYPMYVAVADEGDIYISVHEVNGILALEVDCFVPDAADGSDAFTRLGSAMAMIAMTTSYLEEGELKDTVLTEAENELGQLVLFLNDFGAEGAASESVGTLCGYPACLSVTSFNDETNEISLAFTMLTMDGSYAE